MSNAITYTNLPIPRRRTEVPINAFDESLWRERHPDDKLLRSSNNLVWYTGVGEPIDLKKFQWVIACIGTLTVHGGENVDEALNIVVNDIINGSGMDYLKKSLHKFLRRSIPLIRAVELGSSIVFPVRRPPLHSDGFFMSDKIFNIQNVNRNDSL